MFKFSIDYLVTNKKQLAEKQLAKLLVSFNKNVIGINFCLRHCKYRLLKLFADIAAFTSHGRLFHMAAPEYINDF